MVVSMPLCHSSRATVRSHGPPFSPYLARTALVSTPGRKCASIVPSGTDSTDDLREAGVTRGAALVRAGRNDQGVARVAERDLAHHPGDAAAVRRKVER